MALKLRDQVEKSVLKRLKFHARSGTWLKTDSVNSIDFGSSSPAMLADCVLDMFSRNYFRIIPVPGRDEGILNQVGALSDNPPRDWRETAGALFNSGVQVMITADGIRRHEELKRSTTEIRKAIWERSEVDDGAQWTGKVQER